MAVTLHTHQELVWPRMFSYREEYPSPCILQFYRPYLPATIATPSYSAHLDRAANEIYSQREGQASTFGIIHPLTLG